MPVADGHPCLVYWGAKRLLRVQSCRVKRSVGGEFDCTSILSPVIGTATNTRVVRQTNPTTIDNSIITVTFLGVGPWTVLDIGRVDTLYVTMAGGTLSGLASLDDYDNGATAGEKMTGTCVFKLVGF